jgi:hypothetical protein
MYWLETDGRALRDWPADGRADPQIGHTSAGPPCHLWADYQRHLGNDIKCIAYNRLRKLAVNQNRPLRENPGRRFSRSRQSKRRHPLSISLGSDSAGAKVAANILCNKLAGQ